MAVAVNLLLGGGHGLPVALTGAVQADAKVVDEPAVIHIEEVDELRTGIGVEVEPVHELT